MNKEEKKIFKFLKNVYNLDFKTCILKNDDIKIIENLIEKQQKEIEELKAENSYYKTIAERFLHKGE